MESWLGLRQHRWEPDREMCKSMVRRDTELLGRRQEAGAGVGIAGMTGLETAMLGSEPRQRTETRRRMGAHRDAEDAKEEWEGHSDSGQD